MAVSETSLSETTAVGSCFASLTSQGSETWDRYTYSVKDDPSGVLEVKGKQLCVSKQLDFESSKHRK